MDTLCGHARLGMAPSTWGLPLNASLANNIIAISLYGEETRAPGQPQNEGTCITGRGVSLHTILPLS